MTPMVDYQGLAVLIAAVAAAVISIGTFLRAGKALQGVLKTKAELDGIKDNVLLLEKNTNSIKDALVKTTGEKEFARGVKHEKEKQEGSKS